MTRTCSRCGTLAECPPDGLPSGWSVSIDGKRIEYICAPCARANLRSIEGKLGGDFWEY